MLRQGTKATRGRQWVKEKTVIGKNKESERKEETNSKKGREGSGSEILRKKKIIKRRNRIKKEENID